NDGSIAAMASYPTFDNRWFTAGVWGDKFQQLFPDTGDPDDSILVNRAVQGQYNLGSTFKSFVAYAGLATGLINPGYYYDDEGVYRVRSIEDDVCASGVRCEFRNSTCPDGRPCVYGNVNAYWSLAVSSDTFYYRLGEEFYLRDRDLMQETIRQFGFGADTGIDLPFEFDGRVPDNESKRQLVEAGVLRAGEEPRLLVGDNIQTAIGQGLLAATPLQLAVGYGTLANGGFVYQPHVVTRVFEPGVPDAAQPGLADLSQAVLHEDLTRPNLIRQVPMDAGLRDPIVGGLRQNITGPGINGRSTTAEELFEIGYPDTAIQIAGKTGTAQGQGNYPWNDSSVFAGFSLDPAKPYTAVAYLEKSGFGSQGAAPVVKCMFLALSDAVPLDPVVPSDPLDIENDQVAEPEVMRDTTCMDSTISLARPAD
ncbi:MAG TPA: penicillin-binding transpeptidase domain-containing protein, partial [Ilumatobacteraceae bacterium]